MDAEQTFRTITSLIYVQIILGHESFSTNHLTSNTNEGNITNN